jgi:peptidoglycan/LPS O-acetylase OafA/YrhL
VNRSFATLDGLRGVAALCIVVLHCYRYFGVWQTSSAGLAVDLFFVLSGFVLAFAYGTRFENGMTPVQFVKARIIRLYPLYLFGTLLGVAQALITIHYMPSKYGWGWSQFWESLPFALAMLPAPGQTTLFPFNGVMWSIFFELFINIVWAFFWRPLQSMRLLLTVIVLSGIAMVASVFYFDTMWLGASWSNFVGGLVRVSYSFFVGVFLFRIHHAVKLPRIPPIVLLVGLPALLGLTVSIPGRLLLALFVLPWFVLLGARVEPKGLLQSICRGLGAASYAVYTVHKRLYLLSYAAVLQLLNIDLQRFSPFIGIAFMVGVVGFCLLLNRYFDEPVRKWMTRKLKPQARLGSAREGATQAP